MATNPKELQMQMHLQFAKYMCFSYPSIGPSPSMYRSKTSHSSMTENPAPSSTMITLPVKDSKDSKMVLRSTLFTLPPFHIHFRNPECVRIPWVLAPKNFPVENSCHQWRGQGTQAYDLPVCYFGERSLPTGPQCLQQCFSFEIAYSFICIMQSGIISAYLKWERVSGGLTGSSF